MHRIKYILFIISTTILTSPIYAQELTYGILNRDLTFVQEPQITLEPGDPFPDSLTIPDSVLVKKGSFIYIQSTIRDTLVHQTLYVINARQEMYTTIALPKSDMITQQNQYYQALDEIPKNHFKKNKSKYINIIGVFAANNAFVDYICSTDNNDFLFWHRSQASNEFLRNTIYKPQQKVFIYENETLQSTACITPNTSPDCPNALILDTSSVKTDVSNYGLVSFQKINTKKSHTPDYQILISRIKKFEDNSGSDSSLRISFIGTLDLNNDHINELIFMATGYESTSYLIYEFQSEWKLIYSGGGCSL
jgi:hypothetical protein